MDMMPGSRPKPSHWRARRDARRATVAEPAVPASGTRLHIGVLSLDGFAQRDAAPLAEALKSDLTRRLARADFAPHAAEIVDAGRFAPGPSPQATGRTIAAQVFKGLRP